MLLGDEFGPDAVPVVRAQVAARDGAGGGALDGHAVLRRWRPVGVAVLPLAHLGVALHADGDAKLRDGEGPFRPEVVVERHAPIVIANAIASQVANAIEALATVSSMATSADQDRRRQRFIELLDLFDNNKAELGRTLGYASGAYVRQLVEGERPITEKLIEKVHNMQRGKYRGWFDAQPRLVPAPSAAEPPALWPLAPFFTPDTWAQLDPALQHIGAHAAAKAVQEALQLVSTSGKRDGTGG